MKRTAKKTSTPRNSGTKIKEAPPVAVSEQKKTVSAKGKTLVAPEKNGKKSKPETALKISAPAPPAGKTVFVKNIGRPKSAPGTGAAASEKGTAKSKPASSAKVSDSGSPVKKQIPAASKAIEVENKTAKNSKKSSAASAEKALDSAAKTQKATTAKKPDPVKSPVLKNKVAPASAKSAADSPVSKPKAKKSSPAKILAPAEKAAKPVSNKKSKPAREAVSPRIEGKSVEPSNKELKAESPAAAQNSGKKAETEILKTVATPAKSKAKGKTAAVAPKTEKKPLQKAALQIEAVMAPVAPKPVKKKLKPIGSAVVRGKSGRYDFEVFPLDADLKDGSAIYVISKRITDKRGRGHHKFVCIGQTESLLGEIKKHKKDKCIKQHRANVICLLREDSAANRLKIETDLREAHAIACNQK
ncbi:MAG TPA: hypothetical protein VIL74_25270 [Pyrinomonadaceae bacterium]|jgi:hypothetical protein